jgi:5,10-methylenetetrahydrofolate reductase
MEDDVTTLESARVVLEACPPALDDREKAYAFLRQSFSCYNSFHVVSIPDLQDSGEFRRQRARVPNHEFAAWVREQSSMPLSLYKVCTSCTAAEFEAWLREADSLGCRDIFLVGSDSSDKPTPAGALSIPSAAKIAATHGFRAGGIIIPTRRSQFSARPASVDETERLIAKVTGDGLRFFSTQLLYEGEWMSCLLLDIVRSMRPELYPKIFLTLSPFVCAEDIHFARKTLGVYVPKDVVRMLRGARSMREASISTLLLVWERISTFAGEIGYPREKLGVNVEYLDSRNPRNVDAAFELAEEFGRIFKRWQP